MHAGQEAQSDGQQQGEAVSSSKDSRSPQPAPEPAPTPVPPPAAQPAPQPIIGFNPQRLDADVEPDSQEFGNNEGRTTAFGHDQLAQAKPPIAALESPATMY